MTQNNLESVSKRTSLALPLELEEGAAPLYARMLVFTVCSLIVGLILWANFAKVRELSVAAGEIVPSAPLQTVSHIEGGIVESLYVAEGDKVQAGDPLLKLRPETAGGELEKLMAQKATLQLTAERLDAVLEDRAPDFSAFDPKWQAQIQEQKTLYKRVSVEQKATLAAVEQQLRIAVSERDTALASIGSKEQQASAAKEQFEIQESLFADEFTSRLQYLDAQSKWLQAKDALTEAKNRVEQAEADITRLQSEYDKSGAGFQRQASNERSEVEARLAELEDPLHSLSFISENMTVTAPADGTVKKIYVAGADSVVRGGDVIVDILPGDAPLIAEVQVQPQDIGNIQIGQEAELVVSTYDPNRFGKAQGEIMFISPGTFVDEKTGLVYFLARVRFDEQSIGNGRYVGQLATGMTVSAEIVTRRRSIAEYLLKPVVRSVDMAFTE
ncbi:MAG: HlyD family type I secretion periplasmic adaptor subunit [Pseudomonadota bacterium]